MAGYDELAWDAWGLHQIFRQLGAEPEEIYLVLPDANREVSVGVRRGLRKFSYGVGKLDEGLEVRALEERWSVVVNKANAMEPVELRGRMIEFLGRYSAMEVAVRIGAAGLLRDDGRLK